MTGRFHIADSEAIRSGRVTDVYFLRGRAVLEAAGVDPAVVAEVRTTKLPGSSPWAVLAGVDEAVSLLEGHDVDIDALPEGSVFQPEEPVLVVSGRYLDFGVLETALLGFLCQASGIATAAARTKLASGDVPVYSFGARRMHPAIAPMVERAAYIGGCDGVASVASAEDIGIEPVGTMAHAVILILGEERAWEGFDRTMDPRIPRVALVDTFQDEKFGALAAAEQLGERLTAIRMDTPESRRGNLAAIIREVRWELDRHGFEEVRIFVSGGLREEDLAELAPLVDSFGVGTSISNAPVIDFALDIVEVDGEARAKRGKLSGRKVLWACPDGHVREVSPADGEPPPCPRCGRSVQPLLMPHLRHGRLVRDPESATDVRARAVEQVRATVEGA
jgi:nicotinate phosphoribosyltransferase